MPLAIARRLLACSTVALGACAPDAAPDVRAAAPAAGTATAPADPAEPLEPPLVLRVTRPDFSDWDGIERRGLLRVLVPRDRTNFFYAEGRLRGMEYELVHEFERSLAGQSGGTRPQIDVAYVPVAFERLLPALVEGLGDVAAGGLTITAERERLVAFTEPYLAGVAQIVVANRQAPALATLDGLSDQLVVVGPGSSYLASLERLNAQFAARGLAPVRVDTLGRGFATEDMLEFVHSGAFPYTVADHHVAELWAGVLGGLRLHPELQLASGDRIAWAVRRENPRLKQVLDEFLLASRKGTRTGNVLFQRYFQDSDWIRDPEIDLDSGRLGAILEPLRRLADPYGFDWRLIAAQAYQESRLDPTARSRSGAIGLMQLLPATAKDMGFADVTGIEDNLHAGIRYMAWLRDTYFADPAMPEAARVDFALAAYNAGPGRVRRWRNEAPDQGVDPDRWFGQVENLALENVGFQPVRYVANVNKYYVILARLLDERGRRHAEVDRVLRGSAR